MQEEQIITLVALAIVAGFIALAGFIGMMLDRRLAKKKPYARGYAWGYFQGVLTFLMTCGVAALLGLVTIADNGTLPKEASIIIPYFLLINILALGVIKRWRWCFIFHSLLIPAVPIMLINCFYIGRRWDEFAIKKIEDAEVEVVKE